MTRPGRPSALTSTIEIPTVGPDGARATRTATVHDRVCEIIQETGCAPHIAGSAIGVDRATVDHWLKEARALLPRYHRGATLLAREHRLIAFLQDTQAAFSRWVVGQNTVLEQLARGGLVIEETHVKTNTAGQVIERRVVTKTTLPDASSIRWALERKARAEGFGQAVELSGPGGGPIQVSVGEKVDSIIDSIDAYEAGMADGATAEREIAGQRESEGS